MSPPELAYRLRQRARIARDRRRYSQWNESEHEAEASPGASGSLAGFLVEGHVHFFFGERERDVVVRDHSELFRQEAQATLEAANELCEHVIWLFGQRLELGTRIDWQADPLTRRAWPRTFYADVDIRDGQSIGGVKWVWELNRHHHLVTLGKAYFLSGNERYAEEVCQQLADWIRSNPPLQGVNWTSSLESAFRLINWGWALAFVKHSPVLTVEFRSMVERSIAVQAGHVLRHLSAYSSANNHLIGEAAALMITGLCFPALESAGRWRDVGRDTLTREIERQIHADGTPAEQATGYLALVLEFGLVAWRLAGLNGLSVPRLWHLRLGAACEFISHMMDSAGNVPSIGDDDQSSAVRLDDRPEANRYRSILASAAVLLERPDLKAHAGRWDEKSHWLLGAPGLEAYHSLPVVSARLQSRNFESGGCCVMRGPDHVVVLDRGPLGYLSTAAHGHADALSLTASVDGQPVLIDSGTFAYHEGGKWRDFFRSTGAHNTMTVDGRDQSEMHGPFLWGRKATTRLLRWESTATHDLAVAVHDGYRGLGVMHQRAVIYCKPTWLFVIDELQGDGTHSFEQLWHLPPGSRVKSDSGVLSADEDHSRGLDDADGVGFGAASRLAEFLEQRLRAMETGERVETSFATGAGRHGLDFLRVAVPDSGILIVPVDVPDARVEIIEGRDDPMQGWSSPGYGRIHPAPVVSFSGRAQLPVRLVTAIRFGVPTRDTAE